MKKLHAPSLVTVLMILCATAARAQEEAFPKPGPEHELLKQFEGDWSGACKFSPPGSEEAVEYEGDYTAKLEVGGYFLITKFESDFGGEAFQGRGITGYDSFKKTYTGVWVDSMSPAIYAMQGKWDKAGKTYTETMQGPGPDGKPMKMRLVHKFKDADHLHTTMYTLDGDEETQMIEIEYSRKK